MRLEGKFIAIGGKSGVGKTTLINKLVELYPEIKRPVSYTTRKRRENESGAEYKFISENEIKQLYESGKLVNLDFNYGNYYGMDKEELLKELEDEGFFIIKEIHPQYHEKIKAALGDNVISVLIKGLGCDSENRGRELEDGNFYKKEKELGFDLVFIYDRNCSIEENARLFYHKLLTYVETMDRFPLAKNIDMANYTGYSMVAEEFTEERRITTRNFHEVSKKFWNSLLGEVAKDEKILELGPGNGWLRNSFSWPEVKYCCLDITENMAAIANEENGIVASARCIPLESSSMDYVFASLADPYFYPQVLCEVHRILKDQGRFALTLPDKEWADNLRGRGNNTTTFVLDKGTEANVFSFTFDDKEIEQLVNMCGFSLEKLEHLTGLEIINNEISPAIIKSSNNAKKDLTELKIVTAAILQKRKDY